MSDKQEEKADKNIEEKSQDNKFEPEVAEELSKVSVNPKQSLLILAVATIIFLIFVFNVFFTGADKEEKKEVPPPLPNNVVESEDKNQQKSEDEDFEVPALPEPPKLEIPEPDIEEPEPLKEEEQVVEAPPPPPPSIQEEKLDKNIKLPDLFQGTKEEREARKRSKYSSQMQVFETAPSQDKEPDVTKMYTGLNLERTIVEGKVMEAVLETALNSDSGSEVRAVITRDIYSESGRNILIPKGSRVYGVVTSNGVANAGRVDVIWNNIYLYDGHMVKLTASLTDHLGRKGVQGRYDEKHKEKFTNAFLVSAFNILVAKGIDKFISPPKSDKEKAHEIEISEDVRKIMLSKISSGKSDSSKVSEICSEVKKTFPYKDSESYKKISSACSEAEFSLSSTKSSTDIVKKLYLDINSAVDLMARTDNRIETQAHQAAKDAYNNLAQTVTGMINGGNLNPTATVNQGQIVRIYVNKAITFPRKVKKGVRYIP